MFVSPAVAIDIEGVQPIAFDQPQVNALLQPLAGGNPYLVDFGGGFKTFNISGFLDTGASGVVISNSTAEGLNIPTAPGVTFSDVAIGGTTDFKVSQPLNIRIAPSSATDTDNLSTFNTVYNQAYSGVRTEVGPINSNPDPLAEPLDVFGMPVMIGKTVVIDPKPLNDLSEGMHTFIYEPGTPFNSATANTNPGIPTTSHHVALSYADFDQFTQTTPTGASPPTLNHNPFIGPDPLAGLGAVATAQANAALPAGIPASPPPVSLELNGLQTSGSFLLDTGAVTSFLSQHLAAQLHVRYTPGTFGTDEPTLETFDPDHPELAGTLLTKQFVLPLQGIASAVTVAGFFLDAMTLHTLEGGANVADPNNIRYLGAPFYVADITVEDPNTLESLTLDGIFGMNYLVASAFLTADLNIGDTATSPYNWVTYDEPTGTLGLDIAQVPEPGSVVLAASGVLLLSIFAWRRRRGR